ncbi:MAG: D-alanine--D-alanine ligase, partial [Bacteroidota bacterium]|nr:D-alanine--D-alanine ligase [Bacteroidota bacterium]
MKIGIFFGGTSREREISFAGGRTVFDNLDKALFQPVPIFVDSLGQFILLDWQYIYKGTIRDFYPPVAMQPPSLHHLQVYIESLGEMTHDEKFEAIAKVGRQVQPEQLPLLMDFAFLALHGPGGEDGAIQGMLEWLGIPYSGSGILPSAFGIDKIAQKKLLKALGQPTPDFRVITAEDWDRADHAATLAHLVRELGLPLVLKAPRQGSSIGVSILKTADLAPFEAAIERSLFRKTLTRADWQRLGEQDKIAWVQQLTDIREGIGLPVVLNENFGLELDPAPADDSQLAEAPGTEQIFHPETLLYTLDQVFETAENVRLTNVDGETQVLVESFVAGREFSCIVVEDPDGQPLALPPTEIVKGEELFDYRSKYLPGLARKVTPIDLPEDKIQEIREACEEMF